MLSAAALPNDIEASQAMLLRKERIIGLEAQVSTDTAEIEHLKLMIAKLRRMQFGCKSEKLDYQIERLELQLEDLQANEAEVAREMPAADQTPRKKSVPGRCRNICCAMRKCICLEAMHALPAGAALRHLGVDVAEQFEYVPASFRVIRHVRPKLACICCDKIVQAPAPSRPIERGIAGPGLLAHILGAKFADHLPLYRQSVIYARDGLDLDRGLLAGWVGAASALLRPLVDAIRKHVLAATKLHVDDTPIPVLAPGNGKTKRHACGPMCAMIAPAATPRRRPFGSRTALTAKAYIRKPTWPTSKAFCKPMPMPASTPFTMAELSNEAACWAHARRKFYDLHAERPSALTTEALRRIGELYAIEAHIRGKPPDERRQARQASARPLIDDLKIWLRASLEKVSRNPTRRRRQSMPSTPGQRCAATVTMAPTKSTTRPPNEPCAASP
jgi:transposase